MIMIVIRLCAIILAITLLLGLLAVSFVSSFLIHNYVISVISTTFSPLAKPNEDVAKDLEKFTPIGIQKNEILDIIEKNDGWRQSSTSNRGHLAPGSTLDNPIVIGVESVSAHIGTYTNFFLMHVYSTWVFDENSKLVAIFVSRGGAW